MSAEQLDRLCIEAMRRVNHFINRCAAQHLRHLRENWSRP